MKNILVLVMLSLTLGACNKTGPTSPSPVPVPQEQKTPDTPAPPPPPVAEPTPAPPPPAPEPPPAPPVAPKPPTPAPAPPPPAPVADVEVYEATTTRAHWYAGAVLPATFTVTLDYTKGLITFGPLHQLPLSGGRPAPFFKNRDVTVSILTNVGAWIFTGVSGEAQGTLRRIR